MASSAWEYAVQPAGRALRRAKPEELTEMLNRAASEGWELVQIVPQESASTVLLVLRRPSTPRSRRESSWPGGG